MQDTIWNDLVEEAKKLPPRYSESIGDKEDKKIVVWRAKWLSWPMWVRVLITYGVCCAFPPITFFLGFYWYFLFFKWVLRLPEDHWFHYVTIIILALAAKSEYKRWRDGR